MRRILMVAAFALAIQVPTILVTSWVSSQATGQHPVATVFGQETGPAPGPAAPAAPGPITFVAPGAYTSNAFTIDQCEGDGYRKVTVGGKVGPGTMIGQSVYISRAGKSARIAEVRPDGTFLGTSPETYGAVGQLVSVSIGTYGEPGQFVYTCTVVPGPPEPSTVF